jgi:hypothetical protein
MKRCPPAFSHSCVGPNPSFSRDGYHVDLNEYRHYFREGLNRGYQDSYYGRSQYGGDPQTSPSHLSFLIVQYWTAIYY